MLDPAIPRLRKKRLAKMMDHPKSGLPDFEHMAGTRGSSSACFALAPRQERERRPTGFTQIGRRSILREGAIVADAEPVGLVGLSLDDKNERMFVTQDLKAHASLSRQHQDSPIKRGPRFLIMS
jgi:hypothetical protein